MAEWISVKERMPSWKDGPVLVFTKYGLSICKRTSSSRWMGQHACWITHWMPLPEPPKEAPMTDYTCPACRWYAPFGGVCCNGDSEYRASFPDLEKGCGEWERKNYD